MVIEQGCDHVTMRGIADLSGQAVGTIYNLVGNRDEAIAEAISEYTLHVGRMSCPRPGDPLSIIRLIDSWMQSTRATPELCQQLHLLYFSKYRDIYYRFQERQLKQLARFLRYQQWHDIISPDVGPDVLAEQMVLVTCGLHQRWADRPFSLDQLHRSLRENLVSLTCDKFNPAYRTLLREATLDLSRNWPIIKLDEGESRPSGSN
jgi:hypothetical protein